MSRLSYSRSSGASTLPKVLPLWGLSPFQEVAPNSYRLLLFLIPGQYLVLIFLNCLGQSTV
jgi:hypothetical protein